MVQFGSGYYTPMDREYTSTHHDHEHGFPASEGKSTGDVGVSIGDLGMSLGLGPVPNVQAISAKLRPGTKKLEFVFTGMGKGSGQGQTPEMYGKKQRAALVEVAKANRVDFTTHSTIGVYGLAGMDQQGNFSKSSKNFSLQEVRRAIEFAADVGFGGPVVVHTGEFPRGIVDADWNEKKDDPYAGKFRMYEDEEGRTAFRVVDDRSGGVIQEARKNRNVSRPVWKRYEEGDDVWKEHEGKSYTDKNGKVVTKDDYIDYFGNKMDIYSRVPRMNKDGQFEVEKMDWDALKKEAEELTIEARKEWRKFKSGDINEEEAKKSKWGRFFDLKEYHKEEKVKVRPEEAYIIATLATNAANAKGWAVYYGGNFDEHVAEVKKLERAKEFYEKLEKETDPEEKWKLKIQMEKSGLGRLVPEEAKFPSEFIDTQLKHLKRQMNQAQEASSAQLSQAHEAEETIRHVESAETYALREAYDAYAQAAITAMKHTDKLKEEGKLKKPIAVALENLFPEHYGAHPDELIKLVQGSREKFTQLLKDQYHLSEKEAKEKAQQHITATFDTGHLNMWRKYWISDEKKTIKDNEDEFNKWVLQKIGDMVDQKIIGHVHIDDNYGYHDDHLAPGEGNTPIRDMVKLLKEKGYKGEMIIEPGADYTTDVTGFHSVMKTWRHFNIPVYGRGSGISQQQQRRTWSNVGYGYVGQNEPPYFTFGGYSPSEEWTLWSGVPLE